MPRKVATEELVDPEGLMAFVGSRHQWVMVTMRADGRPQTSPVTGGMTTGGRLVVSTYPFRDKVSNLRRDPRVTVCVLSDHFGGAWVQIDGLATVTDVPEAVEGMVEYYRAVSGEHPDWEEFRAAMVRQGKCLITIDIERWGPIATGGFPASVASIDEMVQASAGNPDAEADADDTDGTDDGAGSEGGGGA
jgi:PPOX class probable F420-dependent enzyme